MATRKKHVSSPPRIKTKFSASPSIERSDFENFFFEKGISSLIHFFPKNFNLEKFRALTEDDLQDDYRVEDAEDRQRLMRAINLCREEEDDRTEGQLDNIGDTEESLEGEIFTKANPFGCYRRELLLLYDHRW
ncbi:hypothetical protein HOLleu_14675 [Holothuria leucospilota]|uniref:Uncharacterized protein n=1 Tax=Holothuria leucospilota TaxID=206669 RepID=A0A9Q1HBX6_HOLLE|nr:hypothetical protein HOLleu_14675 [Holothuria leucospilota]